MSRKMAIFGMAFSLAGSFVHAQQGVDETESAAINQYRKAIVLATSQFLRYPSIAIDKAWEGSVEVRLDVGQNGVIESMGVQKSSGFHPLDKMALDIVRQAAAIAELPEALRNLRLVVDVPVKFELAHSGGECLNIEAVDLFKQAKDMEITNARAAVALYRRSAILGNGAAADRLAQIFDTGLGNQFKDYSETVRWESLAKKTGKYVRVYHGNDRSHRKQYVPNARDCTDTSR